MEQLKAKSQVAEKLQTPALNYLIGIYSILVLNALKRTGVKVQNIRGLLFLLVAPIYYALGLKVVKSPFGYFYASNRETMRSITYGFLKTYFFYLPNLRRLFGASSYDTIVDVGANIGDFSLGMTNFGKKIIAIEPGLISFNELTANLKKNSIDNVLPLNFAAHDRNEMVYLEGNTSDLRVEGNSGQPVQALRLDYAIPDQGVNAVELIKIDVQGHEVAVLKGMQGLLENKKVKILVIEVHEKRGITTDEIKSTLLHFGYRLILEDAFLFEQPHLYFLSSSQAT
jgi:FkbM family methyltransferase